LKRIEMIVNIRGEKNLKSGVFCGIHTASRFERW
jgi:hypothetical protein